MCPLLSVGKSEPRDKCALLSGGEDPGAVRVHALAQKGGRLEERDPEENPKFSSLWKSVSEEELRIPEAVRVSAPLQSSRDHHPREGPTTGQHVHPAPAPREALREAGSLDTRGTRNRTGCPHVAVPPSPLHLWATCSSRLEKEQFTNADEAGGEGEGAGPVSGPCNRGGQGERQSPTLSAGKRKAKKTEHSCHQAASLACSPVHALPVSRSDAELPGTARGSMVHTGNDAELPGTARGSMVHTGNGNHGFGAFACQRQRSTVIGTSGLTARFHSQSHPSESCGSRGPACPRWCGPQPKPQEHEVVCEQESKAEHGPATRNMRGACSSMAAQSQQAAPKCSFQGAPDPPADPLAASGNSLNVQWEQRQAYPVSNEELRGGRQSSTQVVQWVSFADGDIVPSQDLGPSTLGITHHNKQATENAKEGIPMAVVAVTSPGVLVLPGTSCASLAFPEKPHSALAAGAAIPREMHALEPGAHATALHGQGPRENTALLLAKADSPRKYNLLAGVGKTTLIQKASEALKSSGVPVDGFYTEEVRQGGRRIGFDVVTLSGPRGPLSRVGSEPPPGKRQCRVGQYVVDVTSFEQLALPVLRNNQSAPWLCLTVSHVAPHVVLLIMALLRSHPCSGAVLLSPCRDCELQRRELWWRVCVIDEVGKMELFSQPFTQAVRQMLSASGTTVLGTIPAPRGKPLAFVEEIRSRDDVRVFHVTKENRNHLLPDIVTCLQSGRK
ncbi:Cancer-related nucleoside-triphosphatase [Tupaia chinensis]|uniref:Cancer-related nucleoside-triphosphatase n=1 Tax=Tupaia chinensis TaxID=246437 RepID=L9L423_TUPCH|nr:Cancer-related nucleoside-triphosphatase [Tupaia chinensis]